MKFNKVDLYYIGLNANNAICNDNFFNGSITLYPTRESGNIYYSSEFIKDTKSEIFKIKYREFIYKNAKKIQTNNKFAKFICFNDTIKKMCSDMLDINIISDIDGKIIDFLNNKFDIRKSLTNLVPILDYYFFNNNCTGYNEIVKRIKSKTFVLQGKTGAGGNNTYLIKKQTDYDNIKLEGEYSVSKYIKHIPLNITLIVSKKDILLMPISAQLISLIENKFKYVGGDFSYINNLDDEIINKINEYSKRIGKYVQKLGYRGILGIDFILTQNNDIYFMEINPRFQSSSFLLSLELAKYYNTSIAELHYLSLLDKKLPKIDLRKINKSFLNVNTIQDFNNLKEDYIINNGYFKHNVTSFYRKIFNYSIVNNSDFENLK